MSTKEPRPQHNHDLPPPYNNNQPYCSPQAATSYANVPGTPAKALPVSSPLPSCPPAGYPPHPPPYSPYQPAGYPPHDVPSNGYYQPVPQTQVDNNATCARTTFIGFEAFSFPEEYQNKEENGLATSHPNHYPSSSRSIDPFVRNKAKSTPSDAASALAGFQNQEGNISMPIKATVVKNVLNTTPPPLLPTLWQSSKLINIYFVQKVGQVVSPNQQLPFTVSKCPNVQEEGSSGLASEYLSSLADKATLIKVGDIWKHKLQRLNSFVVKGKFGEYAFYDQSTDTKISARCVVMVLPKSITKEERQRLNVLLRSYSSLIKEQTNVVEKVEGGVKTSYYYVTNSVDSLVKKGAPTVYKNTKWLKKQTGSLVKLGGGLVSKGVHLVSDNVLETHAPAGAVQEHKELIEALKKARHAINSNKVSYVG